jgi:transcriptional regulator with XRE-family HTH domain
LRVSDNPQENRRNQGSSTVTGQLPSQESSWFFYMATKKKTDVAGQDESGQVDLIAFEIKKARENADLSILELSAKTGISKTVLHGYERGRTKPGARELRLICQALNVSPNRLLFGLDDYNAERDGFAKLLKLSRTNPAITMMFMMLMMPITMAVLDEEEAQSLLILITSLVRAKDEKLARRMIATVDVLAEHLGEYGDPNAPSTHPSPEKIAQIQAALERRLAETDPEKS